MLGDDLTQPEKDDYVSMSEKFPKLFVCYRLYGFAGCKRSGASHSTQRGS